MTKIETPISSRKRVLVLVFVLAVVAIVHQGCGNFSTSSKNQASISGTGNNSSTGTLAIKIEDTIGLRTFVIHRSGESLVPGVQYVITVTSTPGRTPVEDSEWTLTTVPAAACVLSAAGVENQRIVSCADSSLFTLSVVYQYADGGPEREHASLTQVVAKYSDFVAKGKYFYTQNCAGCHGSVETSTKQFRTPEQILGSLQVPQMAGIQSLSQLESFEIRAISTALDPSSTPPPTPSPTPMPSPTPKPTATPPGNYDQGVALYSMSCAACHGAVETSTKRGRTAAQIKASLENVPVMKSIVLSDAQVAAIEAALNYEPPAVETFGSAPLVGTRALVGSLFETIFLPAAGPGGEDAIIVDRIRNLIGNRASAFGGPCSVYDGNCPEAAEQTTVLTMTPVADALREGYMQRACDEVAMEDRAIVNALARASLTVTEPVTPGKAIQIYHLFRPGADLEANVASDLANVHSAAIAAGLSNLDAWRFVIVSVCQSANVQIL